MARIEIIQIFVCLIGSAFNAWGIIDALRTGIVIRETHERRRREIIANDLRLSRELARMGVQIVLVVLALIALGIRGDAPGVYPNVIIANKLGMMVISLLSAYTSIRERIGTNQLLSVIEFPETGKNRTSGRHRIDDKDT